MSNFDFKKFKDKETPPLVLIDASWYRERYDVPKSDNLVDQNLLINKWIQSATFQIDSICNGRISKEIPLFDPESEEDLRELGIVQRCIGDWVEYTIFNGRAWADLEKNIQATIAFDLRAKAEDNNLEEKRQDIIRMLSQTRFYKMSGSVNLSGNVGSQRVITNSILDPNSEEFQVLVGLLKNSFLTNDNTNTQNATLRFSQSPNSNLTTNDIREIVGVSNIKSNAYTQNLPKDYYPSLLGFKVDDATVAEFANKVAYQKTYKSIDELIAEGILATFGDNEWNALTRDEIYGLITASNLVWTPKLSYAINTVVGYIVLIDGNKLLYQAISKIDGNKGNDPALDTTEQYWEKLSTTPVPIDDIVNLTLAKLIEKPSPTADSILTSEINNVLDTYPNVNFKNELPNRLIAFENQVERDKFTTENNLIKDVDYEWYENNKSISWAISFAVKSYETLQTIGSLTSSMDETAGEEILTIRSASSTSQRIKFSNQQGGVVSLTGVNDPINDFDAVNYRTLKREASGKWTKLEDSPLGNTITWTGNYAEYSISGEISVNISDVFTPIIFSPILIPFSSMVGQRTLPAGTFFRKDTGAPMGNLSYIFGAIEEGLRINKLIFTPFTGEVITFQYNTAWFNIMGRGKQ